MRSAPSEGPGRSAGGSVTRDSLSSKAVLSIVRSKLCLILAISCLLPVGSTTVEKILVEVPLERWECGSGETTKWLSHTTVYATCAVHAAEINHCCIIHDDCYVRQRGQKTCDDEFKQCYLKAVSEDPTGSCNEAVSIADTLLELVGGTAYEGSVDYIDHPKAQEHLCSRWDSMGAIFDYMYSACNTTQPIISSCCELFSYCPSHIFKYSYDQCMYRLVDCLTVSATSEGTASCNRAWDRSKDIIYNYVHVREKLLSSNSVAGLAPEVVQSSSIINFTASSDSESATGSPSASKNNVPVTSETGPAASSPSPPIAEMPAHSDREPAAGFPTEPKSDVSSLADPDHSAGSSTGPIITTTSGSNKVTGSPPKAELDKQASTGSEPFTGSPTKEFQSSSSTYFTSASSVGTSSTGKNFSIATIIAATIITFTLA